MSSEGMSSRTALIVSGVIILAIAGACLFAYHKNAPEPPKTRFGRIERAPVLDEDNPTSALVWVAGEQGKCRLEHVETDLCEFLLSKEFVAIRRYLPGTQGWILKEEMENPLTYFYHFSKVESIKRAPRESREGNITVILPRSEQCVYVTLRDGTRFLGDWVAHRDVSDIYGHYLPGGECIYGAYHNQQGERSFRRVGLNNIRETTFKASREMSRNRLQEKCPKKVELTDGSVFSSDMAYVADFCGHHYDGNCHIRMEDKCFVVREESGEIGVTYPRGNVFIGGIPLKEIAEIELTGQFDEAWERGQCRKIIVRYKDGREELESLYLTCESYSGKCNTHSAYREWDGVLLYQDFGAVLIPLQWVKKIIPL